MVRYEGKENGKEKVAFRAIDYKEQTRGSSFDSRSLCFVLYQLIMTVKAAEETLAPATTTTGD
jgi:hypothetical protein